MVNSGSPADNPNHAREFLERELTALARLNTLVAAGAKTEQIFSTLIDSAIDLCGAETGSLMLLDENAGRLKIAAAVGLPEQVIEDTAVPLGQGISGWVAAHNMPLVLAEGSRDYRSFKLSRAEQVKDALSVPIAWQERVLGVLNVANKKSGTFSDDDVDPVAAFAGQAAVILHQYLARQALDEAYFSMIATLSETVDARDPYTFGHSKAVRDYSFGIARQLKLDEETVRRVELAAVLHDLGKVAIADAVLLKPGKLTDEEFEIIKTHPQVGARIIAPVQYLADLVPIVLHHHERYDGRGYPDGLSGESIPLEARILAIADSFDSMSSKRVYRSLLTTETIIDELRQGRGSQFDPHILDVFIEEFEIDRRIYRAGESRIGDEIRQRFNYYALAVRDSPAEVDRTLATMAAIIEIFMRSIDRYAGPLVAARMIKKLNGFSIEHRLDFILTDTGLDRFKLNPIALVELTKRFQAYIDYLFTATAASLSARVNMLILRDAMGYLDGENKEFLEQTMETTHFGRQAA